MRIIIIVAVIMSWCCIGQATETDKEWAKRFAQFTFNEQVKSIDEAKLLELVRKAEKAFPRKGGILKREAKLK